MSMFMGMNKEELIEKFEKHTASEEEVLRSIAGLHDYFSKKRKGVCCFGYRAIEL